MNTILRTTLIVSVVFLFSLGWCIWYYLFRRFQRIKLDFIDGVLLQKTNSI